MTNHVKMVIKSIVCFKWKVNILKNRLLKDTYVKIEERKIATETCTW